jgi:hypothetical protein
MHPRLSFKYRVGPSFSPFNICFQKNLVPLPEKDKKPSPATKRRPADQQQHCSGFKIYLNTRYNGSHEFDSSRHFVKRLSIADHGSTIRRIPEAWNRPPIFLVIKPVARQLRKTPPAQSLDELEFRGYLNE